MPLSVQAASPSPQLNVKELREQTKENAKNIRQEALQEAKTLRENARSTIKEATRAAKIADICQSVEKRISTSLSQYQKNEARHTQTIDQMRNRLQEVITKLNAEGVATTELTADLQQLDTLIAKLKAESQALDTHLQTTGETVCGKSDTSFKTQMEKTRQLMKAVQKDAQAIRVFYETEIRPDLKKALGSKNTPRPSIKPTASPAASPSL